VTDKTRFLVYVVAIVVAIAVVFVAYGYFIGAP